MNEYLFDRLKFLVEIYGIDKPHAIKCLEKAARNPRSMEAYERHFLRELERQGFKLHDLPAFGRLSENDKQAKGILLGRIVGAKGPEDFYLPFEVFKEKHVGIYGATGSGKSHSAKILVKGLVDAGHIVLILDVADEYKYLCPFFSPETFLVIDPKDLKINFLLPPPNVDPKVWRGILINIFRETMFLRDGACNELNSILASLARGRIYPSFPDMYNAIQKKSYRASSRRAQYIESLQNRSELLMNSYISDALMCCEGHPLERVLIERSAALRIGLITNDLVRNFYVSYVLKWLETYLTFNPQNSERMRVIVIEEAHRYCYEGMKQRSDLREPLMQILFREIRRTGTSLVSIDQIVSLMSKPIIGNTETFIIFRQPNPSCGKIFSETCILDPEQRIKLPELPKQAAVVFSSELSQPYLVETIDFPLQKVGEEYVKARMEPFLSALPYTPIPGTGDEVGELSVEGGFTISEVSKKKIELRPRKAVDDLLQLLRRDRLKSLTQLYEETRLDAKYCRKLIREMETLGLVETVTLGFGKRGNPSTFVLMEDKAAEYLGIKPEEVRLPGKGSPAHVVLQNLICRRMKEQGKNALVEHSVNGKAVDIAELQGSVTIAYEIETEANEHVAENVRRDLEAGFDKIVVISHSVALQNEIRDKAYQGVDWTAMTKVEFKLVREFL